MEMKTAIFYMILSSVVSISPEPVVDLLLGRIIGKFDFFECIPVRTFLGIPYAKPPVGELRFRKPVPIQTWQKPLHAQRFSSACIQHFRVHYPWVDDLPGKSEDCLYLNIWAPESASENNKKAVMVWLHGGGFLQGSSRADLYNGKIMTAKEDVVIVSINYRLGAMGFLYSGTEDAPGNMGLYDIVEALKWVKMNIEYFGGDKSLVTIFGRSSGAIAAGMLCTSPLTRGLFKRIIMSSGSPVDLDADANNKDFVLSNALAQKVNCTSNNISLENDAKNVVNCLRGVDAETLDEALSQVSGKGIHSLYPRFGDELLPQNPRLAVRDGNLTHIDGLLIGDNTNEGATTTVQLMPEIFGAYGEKNTQINKTYGEDILKKYFKNFSDPEAVVQYYLKRISEDDYDEIRYQVHTAIGDYSRTCPSIYFAESYAKYSKRVHFYYFQHRPSNSPWALWMGTVHFDEVQFVFGIPMRYPERYSEYEVILSENIPNIWTNFAKTGDPSYGVWPHYACEVHVYSSMGTTCNAIGNGPHLQNCDFFRKYFGFQSCKRNQSINCSP